MKKNELKDDWTFKCQFCKKDATWITNNMFDIRCSCNLHKEKLEKQISDDYGFDEKDD